MPNHHASPPMQMQMHHGPAPARAPVPQQSFSSSRQTLLQQTEGVWIQLGNLAEQMGNLDDAMASYERAIRINPNSIPAMSAMSSVLRTREDFPKAAEYLNAILKLDDRNGEAWSCLGHCYLMMNDLQQAYNAYQAALVHLPNPKEPRLWYGIGILYDRYGSLEHAEDAFAQVMKMQPDFDKAHEIYFRLGIIYKQQQKYNESLECFKYIVNTPPSPLTEEDIWFQIGHVHEQQQDFENAKAAYHKVLERDPNHAKVLQQLGWLYHTQGQHYDSQERAIEYLEKSVAADSSDAQSWYLLGRCYMQMQKYPKAYEAYQQAVYRDGRNPTFWCSIGVLYYQINQYRDALDAYSRAIRLNPRISEVWYDLGTLYESCNNQIADALDAYERAAELDPTNPHIKTRLQLLRSGQTGGAAPGPTDVHPQAYQASGAVDPPGPQWAGSGSGALPQPPPPQPQQPMLNGSAQGPPAGPNSWSGRISDINPPPQPRNPYASEREPFRGQNGPGQRPPSPQPEQQMRPYQDANRMPEQLRRGPSPPPPAHYAAPPPPPPQQTQQPPQGSQPPRVRNPNYGGHTPVAVLQPSSGPSPSGASSNPLMPYRPNSPRNDGRQPIHETRMPSPKSAYPQHPPYQTHNDQAGPHGPEPGAPVPPQPGMASDGAHHREHDPRPPSVGPKRRPEWDDEREAKKPSTDESRARMEDIRHRRPSTSPRAEQYRRNSSEARRFDERRMEDARRAEEQRRVDEMRRADEQRHNTEAYHPSEAAHHPPTHSTAGHLPPMQQGPSAMQGLMHEGPGTQVGPKKEYQSGPEERRLEHPPATSSMVGEPERAARAMEVDENYDDSGEEDKKTGIVPGPSSSSSATATSEAKNGPSTTTNMNSN
ncbi:hypothetical protein VTH06DRAFT_1548 [Thermothelomyces fergusii]